MRSTKAIISLAAIKHNLTVLKSLAPSSKVVVVIKANAYGHGAVEVARYLKDEVCFGVAIIDEALELRKAGIDASILVLEGALGSDELDLALDNDLELVVQNSQQLQKILDKAADYSGNKKLNVWLKFNSGMNRLGFASSDYLSIYQQLAECSLVAKITAISHLACADNINDPTTQAQLDQFKLVTKDLPVEKSFANSAGIIAWPEVHFDWIRPGLALYGCSPMAGNMTGESHNLKPAMTLVSKLISIRKVSKGVAVGYSCGWVAERDTRIGVVAIGYA
ncbi:MAG: alanine racemase, partial [Gammaproteobacteria bacterium]|nr:alanine racemase [Gammaproteobacteria bacterium]